MRCVILAGGAGTRLRAVVSDRPKPMALIGNRPFLEIMLANLAGYGASEFIICVSYLRECIFEYFHNEFMGIPIRYSIETEPLGTGGAIRKAFLDNNLDRALVLNGDSFAEYDYSYFYNSCMGGKMGLLLTFVADASRYGLVDVEGGNITGFREKSDKMEAGLINAGAYAFAREIVTGMPAGKFSLENDYLAPNIKRINPIYKICNNYFIDIGTPESYLQAQSWLHY